MQSTARLAAARQRDVDAFLGELLRDLGLLEFLALLFDEAWNSSRMRLRFAPASLRCSAASLPSSLSFSVSQPLLPSVRTRTSSSVPGSDALEIAPRVSSRRESRSLGASPLTTTQLP
jgi:hypothetical protein